MSEPASTQPPDRSKFQKLPEEIEPKTKKGFWLSRSWNLLKIRSSDKPQRILKGIKSEALQRSEKEDLRIKFEHNFKILKDLKEDDVPNLYVRDGYFFIAPKKRANQKQIEEAKQLIKQTYRQLWGGLIDADHGYRISEEALHTLNALRSHLLRVYPESLEKKPEDVGSPLKILSGAYKTEEKGLHPDILKERHKKRDAIDQKIAKLRNSSIYMERLSADMSGINPTQFVKSSQISDMTYVITKPMEDRGYGKMLAEMRGELTPDLSSSEVSSKIQQYAQVAGANELIASGLNELLGGRLGFPLTSFANGMTTQAYVENHGTLYDYLGDTREKNIELQWKMPARETQAFLIGQFALNNLDLHAGNILLGKNYAPIGIDFGRILGGNPLHPKGVMRIITWDWLQLDEYMEPRDREFFVRLDVEQIIDKLTEMLSGNEFASALQSWEVKEAVKGNLNQLKANLYLLQEAFRQKLILKEVMALYFPPLTDEESLELSQVANAPIPIKKALMEIIRKKGFYAAWEKANQSGEFDSKVFRKEIHEIIVNFTIHENKYDLFGRNEMRWYRAAGYFI